MSKNTAENKVQSSLLETQIIGSRAIEKLLSWIPLKGSTQSIFLMIAKDTRNWKDGKMQKITLTNKEIARQFHYCTRTVQRGTKLLLAKGYIEKNADKKNVAGNVITIGNEYIVPDYVYQIANLYKLSDSIKNLQKAGYDASDKRSQFAEIVWHLRSLNQKRHIFRAPSKKSPRHNKVSPPNDRGVMVNSTRAAAKTRSADISRSHSCKTEPKPDEDTRPPKELVSEIFKKLESISLFERFAKAHNQAPESKRSITSFCTNIARLDINMDVDKSIENLGKTLSMIEKYEYLQNPRPCGKPHSLARLMFFEELQKSLENTAAFVMDRIKKRGGIYHELDVIRLSKMLELSPNGIRELIELNEVSSTTQGCEEQQNIATQEIKMPSKPQGKPHSISEYDAALQAHFQEVGKERLNFYFSDERPYLNDFQDFQNFYEIHCGLEDLT